MIINQGYKVVRAMTYITDAQLNHLDKEVIETGHHKVSMVQEPLHFKKKPVAKYGRNENKNILVKKSHKKNSKQDFKKEIWD